MTLTRWTDWQETGEAYTDDLYTGVNESRVKRGVVVIISEKSRDCL